MHLYLLQHRVKLYCSIGGLWCCYPLHPLSPDCFHLDPSNLNVRPLLKRFPTELSPKFLLFLPCNIKFNRINFPFDGFSLSLSKYRLVVTNSPHRASVFKHFGEFIITSDVWNFSTDRNERKLLILIHIYRVSHKSDFTLFLLISQVLERVQRDF